MINTSVGRPLLIAAGLFLFTFLFSGVAFAQLENTDLPNRTGFKVSDMGLKAGDIRLHGAVKTSEEFETNVFLTPSKDKFDGITMVSPSAGIEIPFRKNMVSADYEADVYMYSTYHGENHIDHQGRGLIELNLTDYKIQIKDTFRDYTDRAADENSRRIGRDVNTFRASIGREFTNKFGFEVGYSHVWDAYSPADDLIFQQVSYADRDRFTNIVDGTVSYRIMPKTHIFAEADLGFINYYNSSIPPDSWYIDALIGMKGRPTNKILINLKGGFRYQGYDQSSVYSDKNYIGPVVMGGFDYLVTKKDTVNVSLERGVYESLYSNMNYLEANIVAMKYTHKFNNKMLVRAYGSYQLNLYPTATNESGVIDKRYDNIYNFGCLGRYDIRRWLSAELRYDYTQKSSRFAIYNYADHRVSLSGTAGF